MSVGWYVLPGVGALVATGTKLFNEYVIFAIGTDGDNPEHEIPIADHFYDKDKRFLHTLNWLTMAVQFMVLFCIEVGLLDGASKEQLYILGTVVLTVLVLIIFR